MVENVDDLMNDDDDDASYHHHHHITTTTTIIIIICDHIDNWNFIFSFAGNEAIRSCLKKGVVPSVFSWSLEMTPTGRARASRALQRCKLLDRFQAAGISEDCVMLDQEVNVVEEVIEMPSDNVSCDSDIPMAVIHSDTSCQTDPLPKAMITIEKLCCDNHQMALMTGLETYDKFRYVLETLGPAAHHLNYRWHQAETLSVTNQFLMTLIKLRRNYANSELAMFLVCHRRLYQTLYVLG